MVRKRRRSDTPTKIAIKYIFNFAFVKLAAELVTASFYYATGVINKPLCLLFP